AITPRGQLLETRLLDLRGAFGVRDVAGDLLPAQPPLFHRRFGLVQRLLGLGAARVRLLETGIQLLEGKLELLELELVVLDMRADLLELMIRGLEILALALHQLLAVLDGLLEASDLRPDAVVLALNGVQRLVTLGDLAAQALAALVRFTLRADCGFERLPLAGEMLVLGRDLAAQRF